MPRAGFPSYYVPYKLSDHLHARDASDPMTWIRNTPYLGCR